VALIKRADYALIMAMKQANGPELDGHGAALSAPRIGAPSGAEAMLATIRSRGDLRLGFAAHDGRTTIAEGYQGGCLKFRVPRVHGAEPPCAILLNTSGGLAGGDRLSQQIAWQAGSAATVTTQAAEKIYRAIGGETATLDTRIAIDAGADAEWLPQETILFDRARLRRTMEVRMAGDAHFLGVEAVMFGRAAMGETMASGLLDDRWRIWRDGRLVYADAMRLDGPVDALLQRSAIGAGARAMAVVIHVSSRAAALLGAVREVLADAAGMAAASCWNGMLVTRLMACDGAALRHDLLRVLAVLRAGRAMPRTWSC
jgi:urease accessory protein